MKDIYYDKRVVYYDKSGESINYYLFTDQRTQQV